MKKLSIGLLAAVVVALAAAPADAAKKKSSSKKGKAKTEVSKVDPSHPMMISCFLTGITGTKSPGPGCGR